jgi:nitric oxide reductase subunit B
MSETADSGDHSTNTMGPANAGKRALLVSRVWPQAVVVVMLFGFFVLGLLAYLTYTDAPPIPERVLDPAGNILFTRADIIGGQGSFLRNGLMEYGSIFGHGGYLGPDFTADYLHRAALLVRDDNRAAGSDRAAEMTVTDFKANRYAAATRTLTFSAAEARAFRKLADRYAAFFSDPTTENGLRRGAITDRHETDQLTAFFAWSAWSAAALRPGHNYSYTNNWPPEKAVDNHLTSDAVVWSVLSLIALLGGIGLLLAAFGRWSFIGWHGREQHKISFRRPDEVGLTPAQRACVWFFLVMALLFLLQTVVGGAAQHYRAEISSFFGVDLARMLPFNLVRTWHVQLAILWVVTSYLAAGIFLATMIAGHEPRGQHWLAYGLLGALVIAVAGSLLGELAGIFGRLRGSTGIWFGNQGFEYLDLGRFWQVLLIIGLFFWMIILARSLRHRLGAEAMGNMPWLFFFAALSIPAFYAVGLLAHPASHFTTTDYWRFWVVHLWVEDFLELFTTILVAYIFVLLGVVAERVAMTMIYLDIILYSAGGMIGTMHHLYFSGEPSVHMALGAFFSAAEVIPLTFLTLEAWSFLQLGAQQGTKARTPFPHFWAVMFLASVGFWNFLGAGIFGFLINLPIVSYYEIGTALTANHSHAAMMGVYGMLAVALALFCLRYIIPEDRWSDGAAKISFWSLNIGLAWMVFATMFPLGVIQLYRSVNDGYFEARARTFLTSDLSRLLEWLRFPGDVLFIAGGVLPIVYLCWIGVRSFGSGRRHEAGDPLPLFTEIEPSS